MIDTEIKRKLYESIAEDRKEHPYERWHVSSLAECPRAHYFKRLQVPAINQPGAGKILRWEAGHNMEEAIREHVEKVFPNVKSNVRMVDEKLDLTGEYDNLSNETLIEIKTVHDYAFKEDSNGLVGLKEQVGFHPNGNKKWAIKEHAYLHHILQNHGYAMMLGGIKNIVFIYISLSGRLVVYDEPVDDVHFNEITDRLGTLNLAWEKRTPPACICDDKGHPFYNSVMYWCDYKDKNECCSLDLIQNNLIKEKP